MKSRLAPHILLVTALARWLHREDQKVFDYLARRTGSSGSNSVTVGFA